jgi:hypothetical protein
MGIKALDINMLAKTIPRIGLNVLFYEYEAFTEEFRANVKACRNTSTAKEKGCPYRAAFLES